MLLKTYQNTSLVWLITTGLDVLTIRFLEMYQKNQTPKRDSQTELIVFWGDSGTFKSSASKRYKDSVNITPGNNGLWWGEYIPSRHKVVVLDDFDGKWCRPGEIKRLVNHTPHSVDTKGGSRQFRAKYVIITSNYSPRGWWKETLTDTPAIIRRITGEFQHVWGTLAGGERVVVVNRVQGLVEMHPLHEHFVPGELPDTWYLRTPELDVTEEFSEDKRERYASLY